MKADWLMLTVLAVALLLAGCTQVHLTGDGCVSVKGGGVVAAVGGEISHRQDCTGNANTD